MGGIGFDWAMVVLCSWFLGGVILDGWAHGHLLEKGDTFFSPWHGVLYSGFLAVAIFLVVALIRNHARGYPWRRALPVGYGLSLLGVLIFAAGGLGDMIWHTLFGIETGIAALYSPPHLLLGAGLVLIMGGPMRTAWWPAEPVHGGFTKLPMLISMAFTLSIFTLFTSFHHPLDHPWAGVSHRFRVPTPDDLGQAMGIASILLHVGLLMGVLLLAVLRHPTLPLGSFTLIFTLNAVVMAIEFLPKEYPLIPIAAMAVAGLAADLLFSQLRPSITRLSALRLFAFAVPATFYLLHFLTLMLTDGIWWPVHLWTGSIVLAGTVGWLLSYAFVPQSRYEGQLR